MVRSRKMAWTMVILAGSMAIGTATLAADNAMKIGIVDIARVYKDAPRVKQYTEDLTAVRGQLSAKLEVRGQNLMLDESQIKELVDLKLKANATDKDKARIKEIEDVERARDAEVKALQATAAPTDVQKARQKELQEMQQKSKTTGEALEKDYNSQLETKAQELDDKAKADMTEAVNKVAEEKGLSMIIAKDAVMFGGTDVTDAVIAKLDRKMQ